MTTNSPNPVDGDVQSYQMPLLTDGERDKAIRDFTVRAVNTDCDVSLLAYQIALAALTEVPFAYSYQYARCETWDGFKDWNQEFSTEHPPEWMLNTSRVKNLKNLYTTPPAQLLRPVELPESQRMCNGYYFDMNDVFEALEEAGIPFKVKS